MELTELLERVRKNPLASPSRPHIFNAEANNAREKYNWEAKDGDPEGRLFALNRVAHWGTLSKSEKAEYSALEKFMGPDRCRAIKIMGPAAARLRFLEDGEITAGTRRERAALYTWQYEDASIYEAKIRLADLIISRKKTGKIEDTKEEFTALREYFGI